MYELMQKDIYDLSDYATHCFYIFTLVFFSLFLLTPNYDLKCSDIQNTTA